MAECFHCGLPALPEFNAEIDGQKRDFCCLGCQAISQAISQGGLSAYYDYRETVADKASESVSSYAVFDDPQVQSSFVQSQQDGTYKALFNINGISCAACAWLIENYLSDFKGLVSARVNVASHQCQIVWNQEGQLSDFLNALAKIGYGAEPAKLGSQSQHRHRTAKTSLLRLGLAGIGMMQVGMVAIALHAGDIQGITGSMEQFLRWVSLVFATPVIFYSAVPFFSSALRALRLRHLNMDVPVSLALILAYSASVYSTILGSGEVYYDSVSMLTFFLLLGRHLEMRARHSRAFETERLQQLLPYSVDKKNDQGEWQACPLDAIQTGDILRVAAGAIFAVDGQLHSAQASVDESILSGESNLVMKSQGDKLYAGSCNGEIACELMVTATGSDTRLAAIESLVDEAAAEKPKIQYFADRLASYFVLAVLIICSSVFAYWWQIDPSKAFWVALSVLVVTCPCALSLATPTALTAALNALRRKGLLIRQPHVLEHLAEIRHFIFDKTGTLTLGKPNIKSVHVLGHKTRDEVLQICAALESHSSHPIANAFRQIETRQVATEVEYKAGLGLTGNIDGIPYAFGRPEIMGDAKYPGSTKENGFLLLEGEVALAWVELSDALRPCTADTLSALEDSSIQCSLLSGDRQSNVDRFIEAELPEQSWFRCLGDLLPDQKLEQLRKIREDGQVLMVDAGLDSLPMLRAGDCLVAMGDATELTQTKADAVLLSNDLAVLHQCLSFTRKLRAVIRQNFGWAIGYNLIALPAAAAGYIPPWLAAIGMSFSSLIVVLNSLRISRD
jgi:Cu2+-exporting ATPase